MLLHFRPNVTWRFLDGRFEPNEACFLWSIKAAQITRRLHSCPPNVATEGFPCPPWFQEARLCACNGKRPHIYQVDPYYSIEVTSKNRYLMWLGVTFQVSKCCYDSWWLVSSTLVTTRYDIPLRLKRVATFKDFLL